MKIVGNVSINCKIKIGLKVGFAIYQVQFVFLFVCNSALTMTRRDLSLLRRRRLEPSVESQYKTHHWRNQSGGLPIGAQ